MSNIVKFKRRISKLEKARDSELRFGDPCWVCGWGETEVRGPFIVESINRNWVKVFGGKNFRVSDVFFSESDALDKAIDDAKRRLRFCEGKNREKFIAHFIAQHDKQMNDARNALDSLLSRKLSMFHETNKVK